MGAHTGSNAACSCRGALRGVSTPTNCERLNNRGVGRPDSSHPVPRGDNPVNTLTRLLMDDRSSVEKAKADLLTTTWMAMGGTRPASTAPRPSPSPCPPLEAIAAPALLDVVGTVRW